MDANAVSGLQRHKSAIATYVRVVQNTANGIYEADRSLPFEQDQVRIPFVLRAVGQPPPIRGDGQPQVDSRRRWGDINGPLGHK
jgi:hypothetical protein